MKKRMIKNTPVSPLAIKKGISYWGNQGQISSEASTSVSSKLRTLFYLGDKLRLQRQIAVCIQAHHWIKQAMVEKLSVHMSQSAVKTLFDCE